MEIKHLAPDEFKAMSNWYEAAGDTTMLDMVPLNTAWGIFEGETPVAIGVLELTNGPTCYIQALQTNHKLSELTQGKGVNLLTKYLEATAKTLGYKYVWGLVAEDHFTLARYYIKQGALMGRKLMRVFFKKL